MSNLPVDPERLRRQFPDLTDGDIAAYEKVTRRILTETDPSARGRLTRSILETARAARAARTKAGSPLTSEESLAVRYLEAVEKMQRSTVK